MRDFNAPATCSSLWYQAAGHHRVASAARRRPALVRRALPRQAGGHLNGGEDLWRGLHGHGLLGRQRDEVLGQQRRLQELVLLRRLPARGAEARKGAAGAAAA